MGTVPGGRLQGVLADWNDDRGFGFIAPRAGGSRVFVHISDFPRGRRPVKGCEVTYVDARDERGRTNASAVQYAGRAPAAGARSSRVLTAVVVSTMFLAAVVAHVAGRGGGLLWANARIPAQRFYEREGWVTRGEPWDDPVIGPHVVMLRPVEPRP